MPTPWNSVNPHPRLANQPPLKHIFLFFFFAFNLQKTHQKKIHVAPLVIPLHFYVFHIQRPIHTLSAPPAIPLRNSSLCPFHRIHSSSFAPRNQLHHLRIFPPLVELSNLHTTPAPFLIHMQPLCLRRTPPRSMHVPQPSTCKNKFSNLPSSFSFLTHACKYSKRTNKNLILVGVWAYSKLG